MQQFKISSRTRTDDPSKTLRHPIMQGIHQGTPESAFDAAVQFSLDNPTQEVFVSELPIPTAEPTYAEIERRDAPSGSFVYGQKASLTAMDAPMDKWLIATDCAKFEEDSTTEFTNVLCVHFILTHEAEARERAERLANGKNGKITLIRPSQIVLDAKIVGELLDAQPVGAEFKLDSRAGRAYKATYRKNEDGTWNQLPGTCEPPHVINMSGSSIGYAVGVKLVVEALEAAKRYSCGCARWEDSEQCPDCYPQQRLTTEDAMAKLREHNEAVNRHYRKPTTLEVRGQKISNRGNRRYLAVWVRPVPFTDERGTFVAGAHVLKRSDNLEVASKVARKYDCGPSSFTVVIDSNTGEEIAAYIT